MAGEKDQQDQERLQQFAILLRPETQLAEDVKFHEVKDYVEKATQATHTTIGSPLRQDAQRTRKSLEPPTFTQEALWTIPTIAILGAILYFTGSEGIQSFTAWLHFQQAQDTLKNLHYDLNPFNDISVLRRQTELLGIEAQSLTSSVVHGVKTAAGLVSEAIGGYISSRLRPIRRGRFPI